jgi:hypothetical protein
MMQARPAVALFAVVLVVALAACSNPKEEMRVSGRVLSNQDGDPVSGANVMLLVYANPNNLSQGTVGHASTNSASSGSFDVTLEVDTEEDHEWVEVTIKKSGYTTFQAGMPFADKLNWTVLLVPSR